MSEEGQEQTGYISVFIGDFASAPYRQGLVRILSDLPEFDVSAKGGLAAAQGSARSGHSAVLIVEGTDPTAFLDQLERAPGLSVVILDSVGGQALIGLENPGSARLIEIIKATAVETNTETDRPIHRRVQLVGADELSDPPTTDRGPQDVDLSRLVEWLDLRLSLSLAGNDHEPDGIPGWSVTATEVLRSLWIEDQPSVADLERRLAVADEALIEGRRTLPEPLSELAATFSLSDVELRVLCLILAPELDGRYGTAVGVLQDDLTRRRPSLTVIGRLLGGQDLASDLRRVLGKPDSLLSQGLVMTDGGGGPAVDRGYVASPAVVDHLLGYWPGQFRFRGGARLHRPALDRRLTAEEQMGAERLRSIVDRPNPPLFHLVGGDGLKDWFARLSSAIGLPLIHGDVRLRGDRSAVATVAEWRVRCRLYHAGLLITGLDSLEPSERSHLGAELAGLREQVGVVAADLDLVSLGAGAGSLTLDAPRASAAERAARWRSEAAARQLTLSGEDAKRLAAVVRADLEAIPRMVNLATLEPPQPEDEAPVSRIQRAARGAGEWPIPPAVRPVEAVYTWDDIVLPAPVEQTLRTIPAHVIHAGQVLEEWGFTERLPYGVGVAALFSGPSGTGKTMAAQIIASELGVELFHVDLSKTISKYIGETEKNLDLVFEAAEQAGAVLLFDEADALFGKRTEVKDAHDRHANVEVAYLLQRMEAFRGLAILTSNLKQNIDQAFMRRLRFVVDFPLPSADDREAIWKRSFPARAPLASEVDVAFLARRLSITGGSIQQIALHAAFGAASQAKPIGMSHIVAATRRELVKIGMLNAEKSLDRMVHKELTG